MTGVAVVIESPRRTPAGVPRQRFWLEHRSRQEQLGQPREVQARLAVIIVGEQMVSDASSIAEGQRIRVQGFLARAGYRGESQDRLELHARQIDSLD